MHISDLDPETRKRLFPDMTENEYSQPKKSRKDDAEVQFAFQCRAIRLPMFKRQHKFAAATHGRGWMFDFAWVEPEYRLALEVEGLVVRRVNGDLITTGRHVTPNGFREDCHKYATAAELGWTVLRFEQTQVSNGMAIEFAEKLLRARGWKP